MTSRRRRSGNDTNGVRGKRRRRLNPKTADRAQHWHAFVRKVRRTGRPADGQEPTP